MDSSLSGYTRRSTVLLQAAERFEENLADTAPLTAATRELLAAAAKDSFADVRLGFQGEPGVPTPPPISDRLSAVLFDLQSANILVAAGLHVALADLIDAIEEGRIESAQARDIWAGIVERPARCRAAR
jgi:hypothetical protein